MLVTQSWQEETPALPTRELFHKARSGTGR
jgi:hypothetical protein